MKLEQLTNEFISDVTSGFAPASDITRAIKALDPASDATDADRAAIAEFCADEGVSREDLALALAVAADKLGIK